MADEEPQVTKVEPVAEEAPKPVVKKKKAKRIVSAGQVHILATFNNTLVAFTDPKGNLLASSSAGACGFRGSKKGTAYAAQVASEKAAQIAKADYNLSKVDVFVKGIGLGRDSAIRGLQNYNIQVESIHEVTGIPHGGVRPPKARRV
ncbi:MAG: 30S ribosomal protein S11 [Candidatus Saccharimonadales bacterium]|jgi:small subunit ribosomal protein S11